MKRIRAKLWKKRRAHEVNLQRDLPPLGWEPNTTKARKRKPKAADAE
jgi:hypothetical protein